VVQILRAELVTNQSNMIDGSLKLCGKFKFDVYNQDGSLDYSTEKGNFITPTGLSYIHTFAIADCFRYLSVGTGSGLNTILSGGTTGLQFPLTGSGYAYVGGSQVAACTNKRGNQYFQIYCGTRNESSGLKLARGWRIPSTGFFQQDYNLNEFMVTPGPPIVNGYFMGPTGVCHCNQQIYTSPSESGAVVAGIESIDFYSIYPDICKADKAFARIVQSVPIKQSQYLLAQYFVLVSVDSGVKSFSFPSHRDNPFDGITGEGAENWNGSSGIYNLILYGLKRINDGTASSNNNQFGTSYQFRVGESYVPNAGMGLEPSCPMESRTGYISSDNLQCFANETGYISPFETQRRRQSELPSGTCYFNPLLGDQTPDNRYTFLRKYFYFPNVNDFNSATNYPIDNGVITTLPIVNSGVSKQPFPFPESGRNRGQILSFQFAEQALQRRFPVRSFTMGYRNKTPHTFYPIMDLIFYPRDSSGKFFKNPISLGYKLNSGGYTDPIFFPTGFGSIHTPYIRQQQVITSGTIDITATGYWLWYVPHNRSFDLTYPVPPGNGDCFIVENDTVDSRFDGDVRLTGYAIHESYWITGASRFSGLYWTGGPIPTGAMKFDVNLGIRSMEHPNYVGGAAPYVTIGCYVLDTFSNVPTGSGNCRVFFTGSINGQIRTPYIGRIAFREGAEMEVQTSLTGLIGDYQYLTEYPGYTPSAGMAVKSGVTFTGGYSYFDENNILLMQFNLGWSSPCPSGVLGC
jgi:hypothetical protein